MKKLYKILGINENATEQEIKKAYRKLARKYHPDICKKPECEEKFKEINMAYEVLKDPERKKEYDLYGDKIFENYTRQKQNNNFNFDDIFKNFNFGQHTRYNDFFEDDILNEIFKNFKQNQNKPQELKVEIPLNIAYKGGYINYQGKKIKIPAKIKNNAKLKFKIDNKEYIAYIKVLSNKNWTVKNNDIYGNIEINLIEAIKGTIKEIDLFNEIIKIKIPSGIQCKQKLRIKNKGLGNNGHLYLEVNIKIPKLKEINEKCLNELYK